MVQFAKACEKAQPNFSSSYINVLTTQMKSSQATSHTNITQSQSTKETNRPAQIKRFNGPNQDFNYSNNRQKYSRYREPLQ